MRWVCITTGIVFFLASLLTATEAPHVALFSPQGTVKGVQQVRVKFSEQMVPLADPRAHLEPFLIDCPVQGKSRWIDGHNWVYDFTKKLPAGLRCTFTLKPDLKTLAGEALSGQQTFVFSTGGPSIRASIPYQGSTHIAEDQVFLLTLDGEPTQESIRAHVFFAVEGIQERVGVRIVTGKEREAILQATYGQRRPTAPLLLIQARQRFPAATRVNLIWGRGVESLTGIPTEKDQILTFRTRPAFTATFHCRRENPRADCLPLTPMSLRFSAPVTWTQARTIVLKGPEGKVWKPEESEEEVVYRVVFPGPFPEKTAFRLEIPPDLTDEAGRSLVNAGSFPLTVKTADYPPLAKFAGRFGILERKASPVLPVTLRNLEPELKMRMLRVESAEAETIPGKLLSLPVEKADEIRAWLGKIYRRGWEDRGTSLFAGLDRQERLQEFSLPKPHGGKAFEVVGIPLPGPGFYLVELESPRLGAALLGKPQPMFVPTAVLVTNLSLHFKWGRESSLAWVTTLDSGQPVPAARVTVIDCQGTLWWEGETDRKGIVRITGLPWRDEVPRCSYHPLEYGLFVTARTTSGDLALVHSSWDDGIEPWRFQLPTPSARDTIIAHTILDRPLFRAGETVHMKHILRQETETGFGLVPEAKRPQAVLIQHTGSGQRYTLPLTWGENGTAETEWQIPRQARLGLYTVRLVREKGKPWTGWQSGRFRVEAFRVPLMKGRIRFPATPLVSPREVTVDLAVSYLAGGGAARLPVRFRYQVRPKPLPSFAGFEGFVFANGAVQEGLHKPGEEAEERKVPGVQSIDLELDAAGTARTRITGLPVVQAPQEILAELEFRDPNGEVQTISSTVPLWPAHLLVGLKPESWALAQQEVKFRVAVVDLRGKPLPQVPVSVDLFRRKTYSHRKRLVGGFYAYEHFTETRRIETVCTGQTDERGLLFCTFASPVTGNVVLQATVQEATGQTSTAYQEVWVAGKEEWWFAVGDHDRMDLLPEKRRYEPGETARLQVRMPFRAATALVTVEREGILESWVTPLSGKHPVVEVPVKKEYAPNIFVSVLAVRGRVGDIQPTATIDLGRPAYRLGIAEIEVGWKAYALKVKVSTDRSVYQVREKVEVNIEVQTADGAPPPAGSEVAIAAVDEGLLELMPNTSWQVLRAMMRRRGYAVRTATAQMHVVGKRHFGLKALPVGGGGGKQVTRTLFDTLLFWKGRVPLDAQGKASIEMRLNDSLTSFRIVAIATGGLDRFGTGDTTIRTTQDLMLLSGIPPVMREGDRYRAALTLRNTTTRPMEITVTGSIEESQEELPEQVIRLAAGEGREIGWEVTVPAGVDALHYTVEAREKGGRSDRILVRQQVVPAVPVRTLQATITRLGEEMRMTIAPPREALPGRGGLQLLFRPRLADGLPGVTTYMQHYPYACLEQQVSQAIALGDNARWDRLLAVLPTYLDADGLLKYFPSLWHGSEVLTAYVLAITHEAGWKLPAGIQRKMVSGLERFVEGKIRRYSLLPAADLPLRKLMAIEALSRLDPAQAHRVSSIPIQPDFWPTSALLDWLNILYRVPGIGERGRQMAAAEQILRSRLSLQGSTLRFSSADTDALWWLMVSPDTNAVRLILTLLEGRRWPDELPRLVRGVLTRQRRGAWDLTVANAWGVLALKKFSQAFEQTPVTGTTLVSLDHTVQQVDWEANPQGKAIRLPWPSEEAELSIRHRGTGSPWVTLQSLAALPLTRPLSNGFTVRKRLFPVQQQHPERWSRGDVVRIRLEITAQAEMTWVVVADPIPAGSTILGSGLAREAQFATAGEQERGRAWPAFTERSFEAFKAYYAYVPPGIWTVEYTIRLNTAGTFQLPPTRVEALYAPEMFGESPNPEMRVQR